MPGTTVQPPERPGIDLDGAVGYTWQDVSGPDFADSDDNYDALEIGIGTAVTF
jgi:hypothetical protein